MTSQLLMINKILDTKDFSHIIKNNIGEDYFYNYKSEFNFIKNHYEQYGKVPDDSTFLGIYPEFTRTHVTEPESYLYELLNRDFHKAYIMNYVNTIKHMYEEDNIEGAWKFLENAADRIPTDKGMTCTNILEDTSRFERYEEKCHNPEVYTLSTGFAELDDKIGKIDRQNENMVIIARTGIGKTWTLLKMAAEAAKQRLTVGIYSGEMTTDKVAYRLDTLLGGIDNYAITRGKSNAEAEYKHFITHVLPNSGYGAIKVLTPNDINGPATVDALRAFIINEKLDILFIDQYSLLEDISGARAENEKIANISKAIKNLQVMMKIPIISVSQQNRTKNEDKTIDTTMVFGSDRIGQDATVILAIEKKDAATPENPYNQLFTIHIIKSRDGGSGKLMYNANLNLGKFTFIPDEASDASKVKELEDEYSVDFDINSYKEENDGAPW